MEVYRNQPPDPDVESALRGASHVTSLVLRHFKLDQRTRQAHREDMMHTAFGYLYEQICLPEGKGFSYGYTVAKQKLYGYVYSQIFGIDGEYVAGEPYGLFGSVIDAHLGELDDEDEATIASGLIQRNHQPYAVRSVENKLIARENEAAYETILTAFERELFAILYAQQAHCSPMKIKRVAEIFAESLRGTSPAGIGLLFDLTRDATQAILYVYRQQIEKYLNLTTAEQTAVREEGLSRVVWYEDVTADKLNQGEKFLVLYPYGIFSVTYRWLKAGKHRNKSYHVGKLATSRRIDGKAKNFEVALGGVGNITVDRLHAGTQTMKAKLAQHGLAISC